MSRAGRATVWARISVRILVSILLLGSTSAQAALWSYEDDSGGLWPAVHARTYSLFYTNPRALEALTGDGDQAMVIERVRVSFDSWAQDWFAADVAWDVIPMVGGGALATRFALPTRGSQRLIDFDSTLHTGTDWQLRHNLDRLALHFYLGAVDIHVGRQGLGFGSSRMLPAADIFSPFGPGTIDTEFKRGVDAVRITTLLGEFHALEFVAVFRGTQFDQGVYLAQWRGSFVDALDVTWAAGASWGLPTMLLDLTGDVAGATWYFESSGRFDPGNTDDWQARATLGIDYEFEFDLRIVGELHYNSIGTTDSTEYLAVTAQRGYDVGEVYLLGVAYAGLLLSYQVTPLAHLNLAATQNLTDGSAFLSPSWLYDFSENSTVAIGALIPVAPAEDPSLADPRLEFALYPTMVYADVRLVF